MLSPVNEALWDVIGEYGMKTFHLEAYNVIRAASGIGKGNGPNIVFQAGGVGLSEWAGFMNGADRFVIFRTEDVGANSICAELCWKITRTLPSALPVDSRTAH